MTNPPWLIPDEKTMTLKIDSEDDDTAITLPAKFEVCWGCNGKGTHVNRAVDGNGLSADDFAQDPDFAEDYFNGVYDVVCDECHGARVTLEVDREKCKSPGGQDSIDLQMYDRYMADEAMFRAEQEAKRRMGA